MHSEAKYQVVVRGSLPVDLSREIAEAHALAVRNRSACAAEQIRTRVVPVRDDLDEIKEAPEIDSKAMDGDGQA